MSDTGLAVQAAGLAPVLLSVLPQRVRDALPLLSPLAAVYWRLRWHGAPDLLSADVAALEAATVAQFGTQAWNTAAAEQRRRDGWPVGGSGATSRRLWAAYDALSLPVAAYVASVMEGAVGVRRALPEVAPALWPDAAAAAAAFGSAYAKTLEEVAEAERKWNEEKAEKERLLADRKLPGYLARAMAAAS